MRALTRKRLLAAVCMLLLMFASIAHAGAPGRPIDRPEGPPDPRPVEVGDPDQPPSIIVIVWNGWLTIRIPASWVSQFAKGPVGTSRPHSLDGPRGARKGLRGR